VIPATRTANLPAATALMSVLLIVPQSDDADGFRRREVRAPLTFPARQRLYQQFKWPRGLNSRKVALVLGDHTRADRASR